MPYQQGSRIKTSEKANKLGHLEVVDSDFVKSLIHEFESPIVDVDKTRVAERPIPPVDLSIDTIFAVDGSLQTVRSSASVHKEVSFVKTALLRLSDADLNKIDKHSPHPLALKSIMEKAALFHSTVFPLKNVYIQGEDLKTSIRKIIFQSVDDPQFDGEILMTLKWLSYQKWLQDTSLRSPSFSCPNCEDEISLPYDATEGNCPICDVRVYITDMLGFHLEMLDDSAPGIIASTYMVIHEFLLLMTGIRSYFEAQKYQLLSRCLFIKDGPLTFRGQYVKLTAASRSFFQYAKEQNISINIFGQEKTGQFVDHLQLIKDKMGNNTYFIPDGSYIRDEIQRREATSEYGYRTNYGNKIFVKCDEYLSLVVSIPTGEFIDTSSIDDFMCAKEVLNILEKIRSYRFEGGLFPIELANGIASLSTYPSAKILRLFAGI